MRALTPLPIVALLAAAAGCSAPMPGGLGLTNGQLKACPSSPNCVSSYADPSDEEHYIAPLGIDGDPAAAWGRVTGAITAASRATIVKEEPTYLHAEFESLIFRFVDDVELVLDSERGVIHWRSASRTGHSDLGVNRGRLEELREATAP